MRGDLAKDARNLQWCPANNHTLSDQAPISYERLQEEFLRYKFVALPATSTSHEDSNPREEPFKCVPAESLGPRCDHFPHYIDGMIEGTIQLMSVEVQQPLLTQQKAGYYCVYCYCESCQIPIMWTGSDSAVLKSMLSADYKDQSLLSLCGKHREFANVLKEHVGSQKHCELVNQQMGEALT